jgi:hypothetical protein
MSDDHSDTRRPELEQVTLDEVYEIAMLIKETGKTREQVIEAIEKHGPLRVDIVAALQR